MSFVASRSMVCRDKTGNPHSKFTRNFISCFGMHLYSISCGFLDIIINYVIVLGFHMTFLGLRTARQIWNGCRNTPANTMHWLQRRINVGPPSATLAKHWTNIVSCIVLLAHVSSLCIRMAGHAPLQHCIRECVCHVVMTGGPSSHRDLWHPTAWAPGSPG